MEKCIISEEFWAARDRSDCLYLYVNKPTKYESGGYWDKIFGDYFIIDVNLFPTIKWTDKEPRRVKIILED